MGFQALVAGSHVTAAFPADKAGRDAAVAAKQFLKDLPEEKHAIAVQLYRSVLVEAQECEAAASKWGICAMCARGSLRRRAKKAMEAARLDFDRECSVVAL